MKIQIDTENKTIKLLNKEKLSVLIEALEKLLPQEEWKKFTIETDITIKNWSDVLIFKEFPKYPIYPNYPIWYSSTGNNLMNKKIYNLEIRS